jgi:replicative DNA helicase
MKSKTYVPEVSNLRSLNDHPLSEAIGESADVVMVLNVEACEDQNQSRFGKATLKFSKLRDGVAGEVEIGFNRSPLRFRNLSGV